MEQAAPQATRPQRHPISRRARLLVAGLLALFLLLVGGLAGYGLSPSDSTHVTEGRLYSSGFQSDVTAAGWTYAVPLNLSWLSLRDNSLNEGSSPPCVRARGTRRITFAWVPVDVGGDYWRQVVWVACP